MTYEAALSSLHQAATKLDRALQAYASGVDIAEVMAGPTQEQLEEEEPTDPGRRGPWWAEAMALNYPEGRKRRRWIPWGARR